MGYQTNFGYVVVKALSAPVAARESGVTLDILQKGVGGNIETCARKRIRSTDAHGREREIELDAYCNEEGLLHGLPWNRAIEGQPIAGDIVISGGNPRNGETVSLSDAEQAIAIAWAASWDMLISVPRD